MTIHDVEDRAEDGLSRGASDHESVSVGQFNELVRVSLSHAAAIDDAHSFGLLGPDVVANPAPDEIASLLSLVGTRNRARVEGPQRLVD